MPTAPARCYRTICECRSTDLELAHLAKPDVKLPGATIYILPDEGWSRRVRGVLANELARIDARELSCVKLTS